MWGGEENTIVPKMAADDINKQNAALSEQEKIQKRLLTIDDDIKKARAEAKKGSFNADKVKRTF